MILRGDDKMSENRYKDYDSLIQIVSASANAYDKDLIDKAYKCAFKAHDGQKRVSGVPYILHPVSVAYILCELGMDTQSIVAAILHDVVEDTSVTIDDIKKDFGEEIANLVDGVTKLGKIPYSSKEEQQAENIRKMLIAMSRDIRVIIIKLADRLQNMRTIGCMTPQKSRDKSLENMEVFAPIAHRLGIRQIKEELEDLSLKQLDPVAYKEIERSLALRKDDREKFLEVIKKRIKDRIPQYIPNVYIEGRVKSANGIYRKMFLKGRSIEEIYDIYAVRIIVDTVNDCYNVLGIIHDMFQPIPNRFKDYISIPKPNMYQSLHTTVLSREGIPFEAQIRTWDMHRTAEYGIAAHWKYKLGISGSENSLEKRLAWIRQMIDNQKDTEDATDIIRNIKLDLAPEEVFVLTPKGGVLSLPTGATVIDFAYAIHTEVGNKMIGAKVDKRIVPIDYKVKTGEIVEIITTKDKTKGPNRDWLKIVRTSEARIKIKQWFKREKRDENILEGKAEVEKELRRNNISLTQEELTNILEPIFRRNQFNTLDDFYASIGYGGLQTWRVMPKIKDGYIKLKGNIETNKPKLPSPETGNKKQDSVFVEGMDNCLIRISKCCNPVPGDKIIGFITRGYGVSVHKVGCSNVPRNISKCDQPERWVKVHWVDSKNPQFKVMIKIQAQDNESVLSDITKQLYKMRLKVIALNSKIMSNKTVSIDVVVVVRDVEHLNSVTASISRIKNVLSVCRA